MKINILNLIDFEEVNKLLEGFNKSTGFVTAILDLEGNVLSKSGWRQMCTEFHRINPETSKNCNISDTVLANKLESDEKYHFYECLNGLVDVAVPIIIKGEHVANLFSGQFFIEEPNRTFFEKQAEKFGFNKEEYLKALDKVPIVSKDQVKVSMDFLLDMTQLISEISYQKMEQLQLNEALKESEFRFNKLYENGPFGMVIAEMDLRFKRANPTFCTMMGYSEAELQEMTFIDITLPDDAQKNLQNIQKLIQRELAIYKTEKRYIRKDGQVIWGSLTVVATYNSEGAFLYNLGIIEDITYRKQSEYEIQRLNERIATATHSAQVGIWDWDVQKDQLFWDDQMYALYGLKKDAFNGAYEAWLNGLHPDDRESSKKETQFSLLGEKEYNTEFRVIWPDNSVHYIKAKGEVFQDENGQPTRMVGVNYDITERKLIEKELQKSEDYLKLGYETANLGIWKNDIKNRSVEFDERARKHFGFNQSVVLLSDVLERIHPDDIERFTAQIENAIPTTGVGEIKTEFRVVHPDGSLHWLYISVRIILEGENEIRNNVLRYGTSLDITEQKKKDEKIRQKDMEFRKLSANVPDLIFQFTRRPDGSYFVPIASKGIWNIFGCYPEDVVDDFTPIGSVIYPEDAERVIHDIEYSAEHLNYFTCEFRVQIPGREIQWIYSNSTPERLEDGSITWYGFNVDITKSKKIENALRESEALFSNIFRSSPIPISLSDVTTEKWIEVNDAFINVTGYSRAELIGYTFRDINLWKSPEEREKLKEMLQQNGRVINFEVDINKKDGTTGTMLISVEIVDLIGKAYLLIMGNEITEWKRIDMELRYHAELLNEVGHIAKVGGWDFDPLTGFSNWTEQVALIHDLPAETPASVTLSINFYSEYSKPIIEKAFKEAVEIAKPYDLELEIITAKGNHKWVRTIGHPRMENGKVVRVYGSFQDITERKIAEVALKESEEKFRMLLESIPLPVAYSNEDAEIVFRNERFLQVIGYTQDEVPTVNEWWEKAYPDESYRNWAIQNWNNSITQAIENGTDIESQEYRITCKDGIVRTIIISGIIINGNLLNTFFDISDRKKAEEEVKKLNETLEQRVEERTSQLEVANKEMESFSYSVSHDLRAPLRHINGYVDLLNSRFQENLPEKAQSYLSTISSSAKQMGTLIDDLLQFSRTGRQELRKTKFDMNVLFAEALEKIAPDFMNREINWSVQQLPMVSGDYSLLKQVWVNLLDNAVKYTKLKKTAEITVNYRDEKDNFVFFIKDNGVGFDMKYAGKLFGVFQRLHSQTEFEGTGIGLANVQRILQKHNGKAWAVAELDKGATFYFSLPKK